MLRTVVSRVAHWPGREADPEGERRNRLNSAREAPAPSTAPSLRMVALGFVSVLVIASAAVLAWSGITTASGRISASTSNESSLVTAASIDLVVNGGGDVASTGLLIDADGLYPGLRLERCFEVSLVGNATDVPIRMFGQTGGGTGLEVFIDATIDVGRGVDHSCSDFAADAVLFSDTLDDLWNQHGSFESGLPLANAASDGESSWVRVAVEVVDDNRAQDLTTAFWLTIEARP